MHVLVLSIHELMQARKPRARRRGVASTSPFDLRRGQTIGQNAMNFSFRIQERCVRTSVLVVEIRKNTEESVSFEAM